MLTKSPQALMAGARSARGMTLIETIVALAAGVIVTGALFSILDITLSHSTALETRVLEDQTGRVTMTHIVDELHSACLSPEFEPVQSGSNENELIFVNAYGQESVLENAYERKVVYSSSAKTLTEYVYKSNGGSWPKFTFSSTATPSSGIVLASNISKGELEGESSHPVFSYYKYAASSGDSEQLPLNTISKEKLSLKESKEVAEVAAVQVSFAAGTSERATLLNSGSNLKGVDLSSQVTFAFSVPNSETPIHDGPCQ